MPTTMKTIYCKFRKTAAALVILVMASVLSGCQNNGDIGPWFGWWLLTDMTVDGEKYDKPFEDGYYVYFGFQSSIVSVTHTDEYYNSKVCYGLWEATDTELILNFDNHDDLPEGSHDSYDTPTYLLMDDKSVEHLKIVSNNWKTMVLDYVNAEGQEITYTLQKEF